MKVDVDIRMPVITKKELAKNAKDTMWLVFNKMPGGAWEFDDIFDTEKTAMSHSKSWLKEGAMSFVVKVSVDELAE